jgi:hypothetical protein
VPNNANQSAASRSPLPNAHQSHSPPEPAPNDTNEFDLSPEPPASHNDGFDEYIARQKRDPWRRRAHQQDREKERAQANKEMSYARPVVRWDGDKGIVLPGADEDVSHGENVAASHSDDETEIDNHALAAPFNDDPTPELTALVNSLLSKEKQGASSSEDDDNRSNYSAEETERHRKKDKRRSRGKSVSDTDEDDMDAEEAMLKDVVAEVESPNRQRPSRLSRHKRFTAKEKGKGREVVSQGDPSSEEGGEGEGGSGEESSGEPDGGEGAGSGEESGSGEPAKKHFTPGPLSADARKEAQELGKQTQAAGVLLAKKYNKSYESIMVAAGLGIQNARQGKNFSNQYKKWYSMKYPMAEDSK